MDYEKIKKYREYNKIRPEYHKIYGSKKWKDTRAQYRGAACELCGSDINLRLHHKTSIKDNIDLAYDPDNLQTLCEKCHRGLHAVS
jgi:5-methylcytosine-specific restriction enzyme A